MSYHRQAFTLIELLVVIGIIAILAGLLVPAVGMARRSAMTAQDTNNMRQLGIGISVHRDLVRNPNMNPASLSAMFEPGMSMADAPPRIMISAYDPSQGTARRSGRPLGGLWGNYEYLLSAAVEEHPISFFYETTGEVITNITDDWFNTFFPLDSNGDATAYRQSEFGEDDITWMEYKVRQMRRGNLGRSFPAADFPILRNFHIYPWIGGPPVERTLRQVLCLSWEGNTFWSTPYWESDINPDIQRPGS